MRATRSIRMRWTRPRGSPRSMRGWSSPSAATTRPPCRSRCGRGARPALVTVDAHHDLRDGISNGSPVRQLIEAGLSGTAVVQVGIEPLANSREYAAACRGPRHHRRAARRAAPPAHRTTSWPRRSNVAGRGGRPVHVDLDVDVCDRAVAPGCPASVPGGISAIELRDAPRELAGAASGRRLHRPDRGGCGGRRPRRPHRATRRALRARGRARRVETVERSARDRTLVTGIGLLVTHDAERPERADAALVIEDGRVAWVGDAADAPDADEPHRRRGPLRDPRVRRQPQPPDVRGRPCRRVRGADGGAGVRGGRHPPHRAARPATAPTTTCSPTRAACWPKPARRAPRRSRSSRDTASRSPTRSGRVRLAATLTDEVDAFSARTSCPTASPARSTSTWCAARCSTACAPARTVDRRVLRDRRVHGRGVAPHPGGRRRRRGSACACTPPSWAESGGRRASPSSWAQRRSTTARISPTPTSTLSPDRRRWPPCSRASSSRPGTRIPTPARLLDAGVTVALACDCNPGSSLHDLDALLHRPGGARHGAHARRRRCTPPQPGAPPLCAATDIGHLRVGRARRPRGAGRPDVRPSRLPAGRAARAPGTPLPIGGARGGMTAGI